MYHLSNANRITCFPDFFVPELTRTASNVILAGMQLRKDPITRSWVITGDDPEKLGRAVARYLIDEAGGSSLGTVGTSGTTGEP